MIRNAMDDTPTLRLRKPDRMAPTVEKIGGTCMARSDAMLDNVFLHSSNEGDPYNRIFVVSAYSGMTDRLLEHKKTGELGVYALFSSGGTDFAWGDALTAVCAEMCRRNAELLDNDADRLMADNFVRERIEGVRNCLIDLQRLCSYGHFHLREHLLTVREMLAALGEAHSANNTALLLRRHGVDAVPLDLTGWRDGVERSLDERITTALDSLNLTRQLPIITGYVQCKERLVDTYDRGYTEVTFSRVAVLAGAREAIIHKEYHLSSADPKVVGLDKVQTIGRTNYDVADQLSNMGMEAIHPRAAKGLRQAGIPLRVRNAFEPEHAGTVISQDYRSDIPRAEIVTGIEPVLALEFHEPDMVGVKGYDAAILESLRRHRVRIVSKTSNANTITHYLEGSMKAVKRVESDLAEVYDAASIASRKVAIVSVIGSDLAEPGFTAKATTALARADIELLGVHQSMRNVDVQFVVDTQHFDEAVRALHAALIEGSAAVAAPAPLVAAEA